MKILIAYDGSAMADAAVQEAARRSWPQDTHVRLVTVVEWPVALEEPIPLGPGPAVDQIRRMLIEKAKRSLEECLKAFSSRSDLNLTTELREGSPRHSLLDAVEEWKPDLVLVGSTGKTGLRRLFMGSVCHAIVTYAPCNVQVFKRPASESR